MESESPATVQFFDDRVYRVITEKGEDFYTSTTTKLGIIAKPFLYKYYGELGWDQASKKLREAQDKGIREHYAFHILCKGGVVIFNDFQRPLYSQKDIEELKAQNKYFCILENQNEMVDIWKLVRFIDIVKPVIMETELTVVSHKYREGGTLDALMAIKKGEYIISGSEPTVFDEGLYVMDLKSGNAFQDEAFLQMANYGFMYEEMNPGTKITGTLGIHTNSKSRKGVEGLAVHVRNRKEMESDYVNFRKASDLWHWKNEDIKPKNFDFPALLKLS